MSSVLTLRVREAGIPVKKPEQCKERQREAGEGLGSVRGVAVRHLRKLHWTHFN